MMDLDIQVTPCENPECPYPKITITALDTGLVLVEDCLTTLGFACLAANSLSDYALTVLAQAGQIAILRDRQIRLKEITRR